jgi:hypothetical protein
VQPTVKQALGGLSTSQALQQGRADADRAPIPVATSAVTMETRKPAFFMELLLARKLDQREYLHQGIHDFAFFARLLNSGLGAL